VLYGRAVRRLAVVLVCLSLVVVVAGCGGDDEASDEDDVATIQPIDETTTDDTEVLGSDECLELVSIGAALGQAFTGAGETDTEETSRLLVELVDEAPAEIRQDLQTVADGFGQYADAIRDLDLEEGETPSAEQLQQIQAAIASVDQPRLQAASQRLSAWAEENC
jgi:hypothetical protein